MAKMTIPTVATSRLILRAFTKEDAAPLHRILGARDILRYFPNPGAPSRDKVEKLISAQLNHWEEHGHGWWAVEPRSKKQLIGWSGLQFLPETEEVEVGYLLDQPFWGKGLATEAAQVCLQYGFENFDIESIVAIVHPENIASQRVIEKLGMSFVDQAHYFGMDCYHYSIERSSFDKER
ncbi:MAG: GNAT family N-acetyltransferase [Anaerolineales bacterium]|nr:GNAT family N-acetyltransferase [Anaerolineales bacterium]